LELLLLRHISTADVSRENILKGVMSQEELLLRYSKYEKGRSLDTYRAASDAEDHNVIPPH
jgi:hypothetical protein